MNINGKVLRPLISFDTIFDIDLGVLRFFREHSVDPRFDMDEIKKMKNIHLHYKSLVRRELNPLSIFPLKTDHIDLDQCYDSMMSKYKKEILDLSPVTDFAYSAAMMARNNYEAAIPTFYVRDELELQRLQGQSVFCNSDVMIGDECKKGFIVSQVNPFYFDKYTDLFFLPFMDKLKDDLQLKSFYLSSKSFNLDFLLKGELNTDRNEYISFDIWRKDRFKNKND